MQAMEPDRWRAVKGLLVRALDRSPDERDEWLARECADDRVLLSEVLALLRAEPPADAGPEPPQGPPLDWL